MLAVRARNTSNCKHCICLCRKRKPVFVTLKSQSCTWWTWQGQSDNETLMLRDLDWRYGYLPDVQLPLFQVYFSLTCRWLSIMEDTCHRNSNGRTAMQAKEVTMATKPQVIPRHLSHWINSGSNTCQTCPDSCASNKIWHTKQPQGAKQSCKGSWGMSYRWPQSISLLTLV